MPFRLWFFILALAACSARADELFRDDAAGHGFVFESNQKDVPGTVSQEDVIRVATDWATSFYDDDSLELENIEFRVDPERLWLVTFKEPESDEEFFAVVLPDGTVVEPQVESPI